MQNILEDTGAADAMPQQQPRLVSKMFRDYRNNLGLFWRVMFPLIIINFLFYLGTFPFAKSMSPEGQWTISTDSRLTAYTSSSESVQPVGVVWGAHLGVSSPHISFLWLAMCPLIFVIVQRRNGIDTTFKAVLLGLTMALLSFAAPEFIPMREALLPGRFISLLFFGFAKITLEHAPPFWTVGVIFGVYTLICAAFAPVWASLTTQLYMERAGGAAQQVSA